MTTNQVITTNKTQTSEKFVSDLPKSSKELPDILHRSRFSQILRKGNIYCIYHTLSLRMVYGGRILDDLFKAFKVPVPLKQVLQQCSENHSPDTLYQIITDLTKKGLLIHDSSDDSKTYKSIYYRALNQYHIQHMYFLPTIKCNYQCKYCFVEDEGRHQTSSFMNISTAEVTIRTFAKLTKESGNASVTFYGGEPLLNKQTSFFALRLLRQLESEGEFKNGCRISLLTNGSLVDDEVISVLQETHPAIGVSIDGPKHLHDAARVDEHGHGTFDVSLRGYKRLQDAGLNPGISCTLNAINIDFIDEIVDFIICDLKPASMGFNLLLPQTSGKKPCSDLDHAFASQQLIKAFIRLREAGIYEDRLMRRVRPFLARQLHCKDCMGVGGQIVVKPDGHIGPCQAFLGVDDNKYFPIDIKHLASQGENISSASVYDEPLFNEWRQRFPLNMDKCTDCLAISVCGGGCPYAAVITDGSIWEIDSRICHQAKNILEWMIWDTYKNMKEQQ